MKNKSNKLDFENYKLDSECAELDSDSESDCPINDLFDNLQYEKISYIRKICEGAALLKNVDIIYGSDLLNKSIEELKCDYEIIVEKYKYEQIEDDITLIKNEIYKYDENQEFTYDNLLQHADIYAILFKPSVIKYIAKHNTELFNKISNVLFSLLKSDMFSKCIKDLQSFLSDLKNNSESIEDLISEHIIEYKIFESTIKQIILTQDNNYFSKMKSESIKQNYELIKNIKKDTNINKNDSEIIIKSLLEINNITGKIQEFSSEMIFELINDKKKILEYVDFLFNVSTTHVKYIILNKYVYNTYIIKQIKASIITAIPG